MHDGQHCGELQLVLVFDTDSQGICPQPFWLVFFLGGLGQELSFLFLFFVNSRGLLHSLYGRILYIKETGKDRMNPQDGELGELA